MYNGKRFMVLQFFTIGASDSHKNMVCCLYYSTKMLILV